MSDDNLSVFFDRFNQDNPFLENRVNGPVPPSRDVIGLHGSAYDRLTSLAREALRVRRGLGVVLWGEAGTGKSHILARLDRWAGAGNAHVVYLHNLQASPETLPRSLLRAVISVLTSGRRDQFQLTPLFELARAGMREAASNATQVSGLELERLYGRWLNHLGPAVGDPQVWEVLFAFFRSAFRAMMRREDGRVASLAVRWLSGGALDPEEARLLGLPPARRRDEPVALEDAQQIRQVLVALSRLAASHERPLVLALDQVDNLDTEQFAALTRFLEAVLDTACNLLVVTTGIQSTLREWREQRVVQASAWDRIAQFDVLLQRLPSAQAELLLRQRLDDFLGPVSGFEPIARLRQSDPLFPLGQKWADEHLRSRHDIRARDVISLARETWYAQQLRLRRLGGPAWLASWPGEGTPPPIAPQPVEELIDSVIDQELQRYSTRLVADPAQVPSDQDRLADVLYELLRQCRGPQHSFGVIEVQRITPPRPDVRPTYHLWLRRQTDAGEHVTGILALVAESKTSVAAYLRRLAQDSQPVNRVVLVTEERVRLLVAEKGEEYRTMLRQRGADQFTEIELTFAELAELESLLGVVHRAKAGDVEIITANQPRAVSAEEVIASHHRRGRYRAHRLLRQLLEPGT